MSKIEDVKQKYAAAFTVLYNEGGEITSEKVDGRKAYIAATVPTPEAKNRVWDAIKAKDAKYEDLTLDIAIVVVNKTTYSEPPSPSQLPSEPSKPSKPPAGTVPTPPCNYTVQPGDTLSAISSLFYGTPNQYMLIFNENTPEPLKDPNKIYPGQVLRIPKADL